MKIALIFNKDREDTTGGYFEKALRSTGHEITHFWTQDAKKIEPKFDLYFRIDHGDYKYDIPDNLRPCAFYAIDTHLKHPYSKIREQSKHYDFVFCAQKEGTERLRREVGIDAVWVPIGCDPEITKNLKVKRDLDIGFVGTDGKKSYRKVLLEELKARYENSFIDKAPYTKISEIYSRAKIGFNYSLNNDINMRMFEVSACGAMLITNKIKDNGFDEIFEENKNIVTYNTKDELFELIDYYLGHADEMGKIANAGYELVTTNHTYRHRLGKMLDHIRETLIGKYAALKV